jgi:hypothetical protein
MLMAFLCLQNGENSAKKNFGYIINIYFKYSKNWIRFIIISKFKLKCFQINLMLKLFMCLRLELF